MVDTTPIETDAIETIVATFEHNRRRLFGLAYRITGSVAEAEDILQEAYLRWSEHAAAVATPAAWLNTMVTRLAIDHSKRASEKRKLYVGPWLPEPLADHHLEPDTIHELDQSVTMALLVVLDQLPPAERAAFVLHDLFDFSFDDIAAMLDKNPAACRKLASRGRSKVKQQPTVSTVAPSRHQAVVQAFFNATRQADTAGLVKLLCDDVVFKADGGGKATAARRVLQGRDAVLDWIQRVLYAAWQDAEVSAQLRWFNGAAGLLVYHRDRLEAAFSFTVDEQGIRHIYALRNPDKLAWLLPPK